MVNQLIGRFEQLGPERLGHVALGAHIYAAKALQPLHQPDLALVVQAVLADVVAGVPGHEAHQDIRFVRVEAAVAQHLLIRREHGGMQVE